MIRNGTISRLTIFIFNACLGLFFSQSLSAQTENEKTADVQNVFNIGNCVNQFDPKKTVKTDVGYQYWFANKDFIDGRTLKLSVVLPHQATHKPHKHIEDEFFFILEGRATFYLNGESIEVGPNTSLYCPSNVMHGISNSGESELKYLVIKKYQRD